MTLTVAIPSYNKEKYIERCVRSVLEQKSFANEILVIDNNSTDKTFEIVKRFEPEVRCIRNNSNLGMTGNWNRCVEFCKSDLLLILHADDELLPGALKLYLDFFKEHQNLGFAHGDFYYIQDGDLNTKQFISTRFLEISKAGPEAMSFPKGYACSTVVIPKKIYEQVGFYVESMSSDWEMFERIASRYDVGHIDRAMANINLNDDSTGRKSHIDRTLDEIVADTDNLSAKVISYYPVEFREKIAKKIKNSNAGLLVLIFGRNLKVGQYKKALQALGRALFKYGGFIALIKTVTVYFRRKFALWLVKK